MKRALFTSVAYAMFVLMAYTSTQTAEGNTRIQVDAGLNPVVVQSGAAMLPILAVKDEVLRSYAEAMEALQSDDPVTQKDAESAPLAIQSVDAPAMLVE